MRHATRRALIALCAALVWGQLPQGSRTTEAAAGTLEAQINYSPDGPLNVKAWGATGDGTTDDHVAIQAAISAAVANYHEVFFPCGIYNTGVSTITLPRDGTALTGEATASRCALIKYSGDGYAISDTGHSLARITNLGIDIASGTPLGGVLLSGTIIESQLSGIYVGGAAGKNSQIGVNVQSTNAAGPYYNLIERSSFRHLAGVYCEGLEQKYK